MFKKQDTAPPWVINLDFFLKNIYLICALTASPVARRSMTWQMAKY